MQITTDPKPLTDAEKTEISADFEALVADEKTKLSDDRQFLLRRDVTKAWHICLRAAVLEAQMRHLSDSLRDWQKNVERTFLAFLGLSLLVSLYEWSTGDELKNRLWSVQLMGVFLVGYAGYLLTNFLPAKHELAVKDSEFHLLKNQFEGMGGDQATFFEFLEKNIVHGGHFGHRKMKMITRIRRDIFETMM